MCELTNPYDCGTPGTLFTGYDDIRRRMLMGLKNGNSYAVLGGRRCGKTSLLLQIQKDINDDQNGTLKLLPRFLDMQESVPRTTGEFFSALYKEVVHDLDPNRTVENYVAFLTQIDKAQSLLEAKHGSNWIITLLIDELESAMRRLEDSECIENLRNLLMVSRHRRHFRAVVAGVFSPAEMAARGSPFNNLYPEYLSVLSREESHKLILAGFREGLTPQVEASLLELTGRHPYLLQGILGYLFGCGEVTEAAMQTAARRFVRDRDGTLKSWLATFRKGGCDLYQGMQDGSLESIPNNNALAILSYHGVIDESVYGGPKIGSKLFRDWFRANYTPENNPIGATLESIKPSSQSPRKQVFVVHGRNTLLRNSLFTFLRSLGLNPLDWTTLVEATRNPAPHINEILAAGFKMASCAVVLLTPDDEARIREEFRRPDDPEYERTLSPQPRPNVLFEAGMAMAYFPERTVLVQVGWNRPFSDIAGIHTIKIDNSIEKRQDLARRLKMAGCEIDLNSTIEWQTMGDFTVGVSKKTSTL